MAHSHNHHNLYPATADCPPHQGTTLPTDGDEIERFDTMLDHLIAQEVLNPPTGVLVPDYGGEPDANGMLGDREERIQQAWEELESFQRLGASATMEQACCLNHLTRLLRADKQLEAAKETAYQTIHILQGEGERFLTCDSHRLLGNIYRSMGKRTEAVHHLDAAFAIAAPSNFGKQLYGAHYAMARLFAHEQDFESAQTHIEKARSHAVDFPRSLDRAIHLQCIILFRRKLQVRNRALQNSPSENRTGHE